MLDYVLPGLVCAWCGHDHDASALLDDSGPPRAPLQGDYSVCVYCVRVSVYGANLRLRKPSLSESKVIWEDRLLTALIVKMKNHGL